MFLRTGGQKAEAEKNAVHKSVMPCHQNKFLRDKYGWFLAQSQH